MTELKIWIIHLRFCHYFGCVCIKYFAFAAKCFLFTKQVTSKQPSGERSFKDYVSHTITDRALNIITTYNKYAPIFVTHNVTHVRKRLPISTKPPNTAIILYTKPPRKQHHEQEHDITARNIPLSSSCSYICSPFLTTPVSTVKTFIVRYQSRTLQLE